MKRLAHPIMLLSIIYALAASASAQNPDASCPLHAQHQEQQAKAADKTNEGKTGDHSAEHLAGVNQRGDQVMGFDHAKTTHHFRLLKDGGAIEVTANDPEDAVSREQIRRHLTHIARAFANSDFGKPELIHDQTPPGVPTMTRLKEAIEYHYEEIGRGGRVRISTDHAEALSAIHEFLRFQIQDHRTGDPLEVEQQR